jgi:di/tripeptidase
MKADFRIPAQDLETLATWGTEYLEQVIALDSQSDERSETIPSSEGQRVLSDYLRRFFEGLGYGAEQDESANLIVTIPGNRPGPATAFMVHMDTSHGTNAVPKLERIPKWDGSQVRYPNNDRLTVSVKTYPHLQAYVGDDVLHGPGDYPVGFDDKLGMAELMTLARILEENPAIPHAEILLVFRPDEEIGRMAAVKGLAALLAKRGVKYGYTCDGLDPFEVNVENFNAAKARVRIEPKPLTGPAGELRKVTLDVRGVNTHGATAKAEHYRNATVIFTKALATLADPAIVPVDYRMDPSLECNAEIDFLVAGADAAALDAREAKLLAAFEAQVESRKIFGARVAVAKRAPASLAGHDDGLVKAAAHVASFLTTPGPTPLLSEESEGFQGYSNPHRIGREGNAVVVDYRLRDFDPEGLQAREAHVRQVAAAGGLVAEVTQQYINMGPALSKFPELVRWANEALAAAVNRQSHPAPIRGGTGVDPFLEQGIPVANLGTGYFAPESEKELTSRQNLARHALWLAHLVQAIA